MVESSDELHFDFTVLKAELRDQLQSLKNEENTLKGDIRAELARAEENMGIIYFAS
jgi:hypothetical protein